MIAVAIVIGLIAGYVFGQRSKLAPRRPRPRPVQLGASASTTLPLVDLIEAVRAAALRVEPHVNGFDLVDQLTSADVPDRLTVSVPDPKAVTVASLRCGETASLDLPFELALALVPLYGKLTLVLDSGVYDIDGTQDRHALVRELSRRQTAKMRELLAQRSGR
jgi:hypothetical protein